MVSSVTIIQVQGWWRCNVASPSYCIFGLTTTTHEFNITTAMESSNIENIALRTLLLLEWRLKRLEFLLTGSTSIPQNSTDDASLPVTARLQRLEHSLQKLAGKSDTVQALLKLRMYASCHVLSKIAHASRTNHTCALHKVKTNRPIHSRHSSPRSSRDSLGACADATVHGVTAPCST
jgi:hypothetical protein